jgi:hypothetical protein
MRWSRIIALWAATVLVAFLLSSCEPVETIGIMQLRAIKHNHDNMKQAVGAIKDNTVYYELDGRCFAAFFYGAGGSTGVAVTQITPCPNK